MTTSAVQLSHILNRISNQILEQTSFVINLMRAGATHSGRNFRILCDQLDLMFRSGNYFRVGSYLPLAMMFLIQDRFNAPMKLNLFGAIGNPREDFKEVTHLTPEELYPDIYARLACLSSSCLSAYQADCQRLYFLAFSHC